MKSQVNAQPIVLRADGSNVCSKDDLLKSRLTGHDDLVAIHFDPQVACKQTVQQNGDGVAEIFSLLGRLDDREWTGGF